MHYGNLIYDDLLPLKSFTDECKENDVPVITSKPLQWFTVDSKEPLPKQYSVAVLPYTGVLPC